VLIYATHERWAEDLSLPMINHFNHCITYLPAGEGYDEMFLDGTAQHNRLEELPGSDRGARVLVVRPGGGSLETIPWNSAEDIALQQDVQVDVHADGSATLEIRGRAVGDYGAAVRSHFEVPGKRQRDLERLFARSYPGVEVESESFSDLSQLVEPVSFHLRLRVPDLVHPAAEGLSMKAVDDLFETTRILEGKAALEERRHDVVLGAPRSSVLQVVVHLPEGLRVKSLPDNRTFENRFGVLEVRYETKEDRVEFSRRLALTAPRVDESDYAQFRELATALDRLTREKWILERTPE
jgi:hypothetical protein